MDECTNISGFAAVAARESMAAESASVAPASADDELVGDVLSGDEAAFAVLFERHRRFVTRLAYRFFYRREQVEDIVQESFANAYFAMNAYRGGHEKSFAAWLSRITVRACYDALRRTKRTGSVEIELDDDEEALLAERLRGPGLLALRQWRNGHDGYKTFDVNECLFGCDAGDLRQHRCAR